MNNPNIVNDGKATRFGATGGPDPQGTVFRQAPWSIKKRLRRLMVFPLKTSKMPKTGELLSWLAGPTNKADISMLMAVRFFEEAMKDGTTMIRLIDIVDGKKKTLKKI